MATGIHAIPDQAWSVGPMVHYEFGKQSRGWTWGVEGSWWWAEHWWNAPEVLPIPIGVDLGVEFTKSRMRLYTEAQAGILAGASLGPFVETDFRSAFQDGFRLNGGLQGSAWWWSIFAFDLRGRWSPEGFAFSPGSFLKMFGCAVDCGTGKHLLDYLTD